MSYSLFIYGLVPKICSSLEKKYIFEKPEIINNYLIYCILFYITLNSLIILSYMDCKKIFY